MDLAAHCINDVLCTGADPLLLLDYVAANRIDAEQIAQLIEGAAEVCRAAGCMLIGGETAELPGIYQEAELDFAGTCVGLVERDRVIDGSRCEAGDVVIGLPSNGLHTNGFSLVRTLVGNGDFDSELLLAPHRLYLDEIRDLRARTDLKALAHVTGDAPAPGQNVYSKAFGDQAAGEVVSAAPSPEGADAGTAVPLARARH